MAALLQFKPISEAPAFYEQVVVMNKDKAQEVLDEALGWRKIVNEMNTSCTDKKMQRIILDYLHVISEIIENVDPLSHDDHVYLLALDSDKRIQGIARYQFSISFYFSETSICVKHLVAAPWNVRWPQPMAFDRPAIRGAGVLLMHALHNIAKRLPANKIKLSSCDTSMSFYEKIGMKKTGFKSFEFSTDSKEQESRLTEVFEKAFGPTFYYSQFSS
jgi:hypothetical protein